MQGAEAREWLAAIVDSSDDAILSIDLKGIVTAWNKAGERVFGYAAAEVVGKPMSMLFPPERLGEEDEILSRIQRGERVEHFETVRLCKDGKSIDVSVTISAVRDAAGAIVGASKIARDITERKRAEQEIQRLYDELGRRLIQLEAANKELEAFTYSVSHDLRAPLRHIGGFSKILTEEFASSLPEEAQRHLQRIEEGTRRMGLLIDDLLNLARVGRYDLRLQVTGLKSVVEEVMGSLKSDLADRKVEWKIGNLPYVECDAALMKQVFQNLQSNALKFTRPRTKAVIEVGQEQQNSATVVYVRDNGVGFSMKYAEKLFGVFQRLHRAEDFEGTGVGLATVQRIIQKHGGRIWAEAELDKGATFYFTLGNSEKTELKAKTQPWEIKHDRAIDRNLAGGRQQR